MSPFIKMHKKHTLFIAGFLAIFALIFISPKSVRAAGEGIMISPVRIEDLANAGQVLQKAIKVTNDSDNAKSLYAYIKGFQADGEVGAAKLVEPGTGDEASLAAWIKIDGNGFDFAPHEERVIPFSIDIPQNIGPGGYYGAIVFGTQAPKLQGGTNAEKGAAIAIAQQTGALILIQIAGNVKEDANVREFSTDKDFYATPFEVKFKARIENLGNVHLKPHGTIEISNMFGQQVNSIRINDNGANVLPKSIRRFDEVWKGDLAFGRYKAALAMSYGTPVGQGGQGMQTLYQEIYFWVIPWKIIIPGLLGITFITALIILFLKFYKSRAVKKAMEEIGMTRVRYVKKIEGPSPALHMGLMTVIVAGAFFVLVGAVYFLFFA